MDNSEFVLHQLQTGMGVLGLRRLFPGVPIKGRVVVCADNGTKTYPLYPQYTDESHFSYAHGKPPTKPKETTKVKFCELPCELGDRDVIHKVSRPRTTAASGKVL